MNNPNDTSGFLFHCGKKTRVRDSRIQDNEQSVIRTRQCRVCGQKFKTEEFLIAEKSETRYFLIQKINCPVSRSQLEKMMSEYTSLKMIANDLGVSTTTLDHWLQEYDL